MTDPYPIITVQIAGTVHAQGPTVKPVGSDGRLPTDDHGRLAVWVGDTAVATGRPVTRPCVASLAAI